MKAVQKFSPEYLERCGDLSPDEIASFLDQFRQVHGQGQVPPSRSKLISMKVPEDMLAAFKVKARMDGTPYQTQIKKLMAEWLVR